MFLHFQGGNPAAVCPLLEDISDDSKQKIAMEMNLSETAYLVPLEKWELTVDLTYKVQKRFELRWFTPTSEVPLCGHATLASANVIFNHFGNENEVRKFLAFSKISEHYCKWLNIQYFSFYWRGFFSNNMTLYLAIYQS